MPLPNGVDPSGTVHEICPSAAWLGNRGILHDGNGAIFRKWATKAWVTCALHYKDRNRKPFMQPRRYSELFFLDEATALAAGHRPCAECRRDDFNKFKAASMRGDPDCASDGFLSAAKLDDTLHVDRVDQNGDRVVFVIDFENLPNSAMYLHDGQPYLKWRGRSFLWSDRGYAASITGIEGPASVKALTPRATVRALAAGYAPQVHESVSR